MPRGLQRGKVAAIGWSQVSHAEVAQGMTSATYADAAAFESDWTKTTSGGSIGIASIGAGGVLFSWNGGGPAYYEKTIGGLTPGVTYDAIIPVRKSSGYDLTGIRVGEIDDADGTTELGRGIANDASVSLRHRFTAGALGDVTMRFGTWVSNFIINGNLTVGTIAFREVDGTAATKTLLFRFDGALSWPAPKEGSRNRRSEYGLGALYELPGADYFLRGTARRIPQVGGVMDDGETITGWDDAGGWQDFLVAARDKQPLTFYPDASDLDTSVSSYLVEPMQGPPDSDGPGYYQLPIKLVSISPFDGY